MTSIRVHHSRYRSFLVAPRTSRSAFFLRSSVAMLGVLVAGYVYSMIATVGLSYHIQREWSQTDTVTESQRALEQAYAHKLEELRTVDGSALGLVAPSAPRFMDPSAVVAKANL